MTERKERRVLGAICWVDGVTQLPVNVPLTVRSATASLTRNLSGLFVITTAHGLEQYAATFDLAELSATALPPVESLTISGEVRDPSGRYLARAFTIRLPRDPAPGLPLPANSVFRPVNLPLLPTPNANLMAAWTQVRAAVTRPTGEAFPNVLVRVAAKDDGRILGRGMSDARGEALVAIPGLPRFREGATPEAIVTSETAVRVEFIPPPHAGPLVDPSELDALAAVPANILPAPPALKAGGVYSLRFAVTP